MNYSIEPMIVEHIQDVLTLFKECELGAWSESDLIREIENSNARLFVAKDARRIIGFVSARLITTEFEILNIGVETAARRAGIGGLLLGRIVDEAVEKQAETIFLEVRESNAAAQNFYAAQQFKVVGKRKNYYSNPFEDALLMALKIGS